MKKEAATRWESQMSQQRQCNKLEHILSQESDRGAAILGLSYIEEQLGEMLKNFLIESKASEMLLTRQISTLEARLLLSYSLGLINDDEYHGLDLLRKIRNDFAHNFVEELSFDDPQIATRCGILFHDDHFWISGRKVKTNRDKFISSACILSRSLLFRVGPEDRIQTRD